MSASHVVAAALVMHSVADAAGPAALRGSVQGEAPSARRLNVGFFKLRWYGDQNKCLDVKDHGNWNGNTVQLWDCMSNDNDQYWTQDGDGKIRWKSHPEKCLDVKDHNTQNGARFQIWDCQGSNPDQSFHLDDNRPAGAENIPRPVGRMHWTTHPDKCMDVKDHGDFNGNVIQTWDCQAGNDDQAWVMDYCEGCPWPFNALVAHAVEAKNTSGAAAAVGARNTSGTAEAEGLHSEDVSSKFKLRWYSDQNKCLDVKDHGNYNGNSVQLWDCQEYNNDQYWYSDNSKIRWASHPDKCLDVKDHNTQNGARLQIWDCQEGDADQTFYLDNSRPAGAANIPEPVGKLRWATHYNMCVDVKDHGDYNGNVIQTWECLDGDVDQVWVQDLVER